MTVSKSGRIPKAGKSQKKPLLPLLGFIQEDKVIYHNVCAECLGQCNVGFLVICSVTCEPLWAKVSCFFKFSPGVLDTPGFFNPFSPFSAWLSKFLLMFGCGPASISISYTMDTSLVTNGIGTNLVLGWCFSNDYWARHQ